MKSLSYWLFQHPQEYSGTRIHISVPVRCSDVQKVVLQGMLSMQEAPSSKSHNFLGAIQPVLAHF